MANKKNGKTKLEKGMNNKTGKEENQGKQKM